MINNLRLASIADRALWTRLLAHPLLRKSISCNDSASERIWVLWLVLIAPGSHRITDADNWNINYTRDPMINVSIAIDIQRGRIMACRLYFEVVAITESGFQLIFGFFWLRSLIEFQTHKIGNRKQRVSSCNPSNYRYIDVPDLHKQCHWPQNFSYFLCFVDRAAWYIRVMRTNLIHYLSSVYFVSQPLHVSGISVAHHQEVHFMFIYIYIYTHKGGTLYVYIYI